MQHADSVVNALRRSMKADRLAAKVEGREVIIRLVDIPETKARWLRHCAAVRRFAQLRKPTTATTQAPLPAAGAA